MINREGINGMRLLRVRLPLINKFKYIYSHEERVREGEQIMSNVISDHNNR
mgnify:CR=1 FL=1